VGREEGEGGGPQAEEVGGGEGEGEEGTEGRAPGCPHRGTLRSLAGWGGGGGVEGAQGPMPCLQPREGGTREGLGGA